MEAEMPFNGPPQRTVPHAPPSPDYSKIADTDLATKARAAHREMVDVFRELRRRGIDVHPAGYSEAILNPDTLVPQTIVIRRKVVTEL